MFDRSFACLTQLPLLLVPLFIDLILFLIGSTRLVRVSLSLRLQLTQFLLSFGFFKVALLFNLTQI